MRNAFIQTLCDLAATQEDLFIVCGDLGYSVLESFAARYPHRFLNAGISEQNMTQVAAGLAREGYNVFTYSIGNFPTLRCMEQIRYDVCYHGANVKIVAVGGGYAYGPQGVSHHTTEDLAMMRTLPSMEVCVPADAEEAKAAARYMAGHHGPGYIRLNKTGEPLLHNPGTRLTLRPGAFLRVKEGEGTLVLSTGAITSKIFQEVQELNPSWAVWSCPFIGNYAASTLIEIAMQFDRIVTVEEHQLNGGFGGSILEGLSDLYAGGSIARMPKVTRIGIPNRFIGVCGSQEYLRDAAGLTIRQA